MLTSGSATTRRYHSFRYILQSSFITLLLSGISFFSIAQCPPNIDFENGTFDNWICYTGSVSAAGGQNSIFLSPSGGPVPGQHTMFSSALGTQFDPFGGFPVNCPNGSGYSIKLGNDQGGAGAEGVSYEFTIPPGRDEYSLIYNYAVVFQDPNHQIYQQPRLEIEITNLTDNQLIQCSSFTFIPNGSVLPGFFVSPVKVDTTEIWCKDWSAVSINLNGNAGKTIRLLFKTSDCTFQRHFGYAYIDVNSECSSQFVGATYCRGDRFVEVTAPWGYQQYSWYNSTFSQMLGTQQNIRFTPPPPVGSTIAVEVVPYDGYGCRDTLYAILIDTLSVSSNAGKDTLSCNGVPVLIGAIPKPGLIYNWSPVSGLSNPGIANPRAGPAATTMYVLSTSSMGGGCVSTDSVIVKASAVDSTIQLIGKESFCITSDDSALLVVSAANNTQWYKNNNAISGATLASYNVRQSGSYYAVVTNADGCRSITAEKNILIETPRPGIRYPIEYTVVNHPHTLQARTIGVEVEWMPSTFLNSSTSFTPIYTGTTDVLYNIEITTVTGCVTVDTLLVKPLKEVKIYVPTAFTPNNDGLNDYLKPIAAGIKELKYFRIYNRWGQIVFDLRSNAKGWDGKLKGMLQATQVFVWMAEGIGVDNKIYNGKGTAALLR